MDEENSPFTLWNVEFPEGNSFFEKYLAVARQIAQQERNYYSKSITDADFYATRYGKYYEYQAFFET